MATTTKTLTPTNQTITIPDMTERPNVFLLTDGIGKEADAINALNSNMLPFDNNFGTINKSKIRQVCGTFSVTGSGTDTYVVPLSTITGGRITDNSYLIAVSLVTYDLGYIAVGTRLSSTAGNMVVKFSDNIPNNTQVSLRYLITYYTT